MNYDELFNNSYDIVMEKKCNEFIDAFYDIFLKQSELIKDAFKNTDMEEQKSMLKESIVFMVSFASNHQAGPFLEKLALKHSIELKIMPSMYEIWLESLIQAVSEIHPATDESTRLAWRITLSPGIEFMKNYHFTLEQ